MPAGNLSSMPPREALRERLPHGNYARYKLGCRCEECRAANSRYVGERERARRDGDTNGIVSADRARAHLLALAKAGIGRRQVSLATDIPQSTLSQVRSGAKSNIRERTERKILGVTAGCAADRALIGAKETWRLIGEILAAGFTRRFIARELGSKGKTPSLQLNLDLVTVKSADKVRKLHGRLGGSESLRLVSPRSADAHLQALLNEGFRAAELIRKVGEREWLHIRSGKQITAGLRDRVARIYEEMTA